MTKKIKCAECGKIIDMEKPYVRCEPINFIQMFTPPTKQLFHIDCYNKFVKA